MSSALTSANDPFGVQFDLEQGVMLDATHCLTRRASDMRGYYADEPSLERLIDERNDPVHYEVFEKPVPEEYGHLMYCISSLRPGVIGAEFFMTKGHYHHRIETGEIYLCLRGEGYLLLKTTSGECRWEKFTRGRMVYVPPYWAHRSINTGQEELISFCVYPAEAGHNYGDIHIEGFPKRFFCRDGQVSID
jgi:glucose-6-phosphate isomerase